MEERKLNNQNHHHHHHHQHHHHHHHEDDDGNDDDDDDDEGSSCRLGGWGSMLYLFPSRFKTHDQMYKTHTTVSKFQLMKKVT